MKDLAAHRPMIFRFRKKGLPKRLMRIPGGVPGLAAACNIDFGKGPAAKVAVFRNRISMRRFYKRILPLYRGLDPKESDSLGPKCAGFVQKLCIHREKWAKGGRLLEMFEEADRNYFCLVGLVEGDLTAEIIAHEAVHVGFAWDYRTQGESHLSDPHNDEENVCYAAGIFLDQCLSFIKREGLRET